MLNKPDVSAAQPVILITGASRGIGYATASLLARDGYHVFGTSRKPSSTDGAGYETLPLDVTSDASVQSCVAAVIARCGRIDVLVNNAASFLAGAAEEISLAEAHALFETSFFGMARVTGAVLPGMRERRSGRIINFGSAAAHLPIPFHGYISASKAAVVSYSEALRLELKPLNVHVSLVEPGFVATHPHEAFAQLTVKRSIDDYAVPERHAFAVFKKGETYGTDPKVVAETVRRIVRSNRPAGHYLVGSATRLVRLAGIAPYSVMESLMARRLHVSSKAPSARTSWIGRDKRL